MVVSIFSATTSASARKFFLIKVRLILLLHTCFLIISVFCSGDEGHSTENAPDAGATTAEVSKSSAVPEVFARSAFSGDAEKTAPAPKKKLKKAAANKGIAISDNPSGPPLDDVSFSSPSLLLNLFHFLAFVSYISSFFQPITQEYLDMASRAIGFRSEAETMRSNFFSPLTNVWISCFLC